MSGAERILIAKADAMRSQRDFFLAVDMPVAADHCAEAATAYESEVFSAAMKRGEHITSGTGGCWCSPSIAVVEGR